MRAESTQEQARACVPVCGRVCVGVLCASVSLCVCVCVSLSESFLHFIVDCQCTSACYLQFHCVRVRVRVSVYVCDFCTCACVNVVMPVRVSVHECQCVRPCVPVPGSASKRGMIVGKGPGEWSAPIRTQLVRVTAPGHHRVRVLTVFA